MADQISHPVIPPDLGEKIKIDIETGIIEGVVVGGTTDLPECPGKEQCLDWKALSSGEKCLKCGKRRQL
ncbi:hypothetical protein [Chitinibacter tainanensis]|uniref:hypothetical protein n=1 Tax=Chitinibacter tainanensis TaxID=230667 RepID=UPI0012EC5670|nr:hypothetical protein [Chitinibacter tainanensis]